jgi:hypothetical protein
MAQFLDRDFAVPEAKFPPGRARGSQEREFPHGEITLFEALQHFLPDGACCAGDGDVRGTGHGALGISRKCPIVKCSIV